MSVTESGLMPSFLLGFEDVIGADCRVYGLICRRCDGKVITNLPAHASRNNAISYGWGGDDWSRCMQLAMDILQEFVPRLFDLYASDGELRSTLEAFCEDIIMTMPEYGGRIQAETIEMWLQARGITPKNLVAIVQKSAANA